MTDQWELRAGRAFAAGEEAIGDLRGRGFRGLDFSVDLIVTLLSLSITTVTTITTITTTTIVTIVTIVTMTITVITVNNLSATKSCRRSSTATRRATTSFS